MSDIAMTEMWRYSHCHSNPKSAHIVWLTSSGMQVIFCYSFPDIFQIWNQSHHSGITREDLIWTQLEKKNAKQNIFHFHNSCKNQMEEQLLGGLDENLLQRRFGDSQSQVFLPLRVSAVHHWNWVSLFWLWLFKCSLVVFSHFADIHIICYIQANNYLF